MDNSEFARKDEQFLKACKKLKKVSGYSDFEPSTRQASKFRRKTGAAWKHMKGLLQ